MHNNMRCSTLGVQLCIYIYILRQNTALKAINRPCNNSLALLIGSIFSCSTWEKISIDLNATENAFK